MRVSRHGSGFLVAGILTIKGISKPVSFPFQSSVDDHDLVFNGNFRIDRQDFDIGGGIVIGRTVDVALKQGALALPGYQQLKTWQHGAKRK